MSDNKNKKHTLSNQEMRDCIIEAVTKKGHEIIPLLGSGISKPSGIMTGQELGEYLTYVIYKCVGKIKPQSSDKHYLKDCWDIEASGWPSHPTQAEKIEVSQWATEQYVRLLQEFGCDDIRQLSITDSAFFANKESSYNYPPFLPLVLNWKEYAKKDGPLSPDIIERSIELELKYKARDEKVKSYFIEKGLYSKYDPFKPRPGVSRTSHKYLVDTAVRSLHDWRAALFFLARYRKDEENRFIRDDSSQYIIDSFNIFLTRGRKPNLAHNMIAYLSRVIKTRKILTTNFDCLLEDAFTQIGFPLQIFSVEKNSTLPNADSVDLRPSLVKLHGDLHETRADYSLDKPPSQLDKSTFLNYLLPNCWSKKSIHKAGASHLIIMGSTISDKRTVELIKYACDMLSPEYFKVYVISYSTSTINFFKTNFGSEYSKFFLFTETSRLDLFLFDLFQVATFSLPPGLFSYQSTQHIPPYDENESENLRKNLIYEDAAQAQVTQASILENISQEKSFTVIGGKSQVTLLGSDLYYAVSRYPFYLSSIWLELEDFVKPELLLTEIFKEIAMRKGFCNSEYTNFNIRHEFSTNDEKVIESLCNHLKIESTTNKWVLFLYGRNGVGGCSGIHEEYKYDIEDSANVQSGKNDWKIGNTLPTIYHKLMHIITKLGQFGFRIVYMPLTNEKIDADKNGLSKSEKTSKTAIKKYHSYLESEKEYCHDININYRVNTNVEYMDQISNLMEWINRPDDHNNHLSQISFLYAATLFRQSRHLSSLLSESTQPISLRYKKYFIPKHAIEKQEINQDRQGQSIDEEFLHNRNVLKWLDKLFKNDLSVFIRKPGGLAWMSRHTRMSIRFLIENQENQFQRIKQRKSTFHSWIAEWYFRAYISTYDPGILIEVLFHKISCVRTIKTSLPIEKEHNIIEKTTYRLALLVSSLCALSKALNSARHTIVTQFDSHSATKILFWDSIKLELLTLDDTAELSITGCSPKSKCELFHKFVTKINSILDLGSSRSELIDYGYLHQLFLVLRSESINIEREYIRESRVFSLPLYGNMESSSLPNSLNLIDLDYSMYNDIVISFNPTSDDRGWEKPFDDFVAKHKCTHESFFTTYELLKNSVWNYIENTNDDSDEKSESEFKKMKYIIFQKLHNKPNIFLMFCQFLSEYIYAWIRSAKCRKRVSDIDLFYTKCIQNNSRKKSWKFNESKYWSIAGAMSQLCLDLLMYIHPFFHQKENKLRIKLLTFSALSLSKLRKFDQALQALNDADAYVHNMNLLESRKEHAILRLRRAELHLIEAYSYREKLHNSYNSDHEFDYSIYRLHIQKLDLATIALDYAENKVDDYIHSALWCGKLYRLRLAVFAIHYVVEEPNTSLMPIAYRNRAQSQKYLQRLLNLALLTCGQDHYRKSCCFDIYFQAFTKMNSYLSINHFRQFTDSKANLQESFHYFRAHIEDIRPIVEEKDVKDNLGLLDKYQSCLALQYDNYANGVWNGYHSNKTDQLVV